MLNQTDIDLLYTQISSFISKANPVVDKSGATQLLSSDVCKNLTTSFTKFIYEGTLKYIKGQQEHGGDLTTRDLDKEMYNEQLDLFFYNEARRWKHLRELQHNRMLAIPHNNGS